MAYRNKHRRPRPKKDYKPKKDNTEIKCWFCKKTGHTENQCWKKKKRSIKLISKQINSLLKENEEDSYSDTESNSDIEEIQSSSSEESYHTSNEQGKDICKSCINVISKEEKEVIFDLIQEIPDNNLKEDYLNKLKDLILEEPSSSKKVKINEQFSLNKIWE